MITVKQFADERGISIQAVHQAMNRKKNKEKLEGHVNVIDGVKWLDDEAVVILDESRNKVAVVIQREDTDERIRQLEEENRTLLIKVASQADKIAQLSEWKSDNALLIANADLAQKALADATEKLDQVPERIREVETKLTEHYQEEIKRLMNELKVEKERKWKFPWSKY